MSCEFRMKMRGNGKKITSIIMVVSVEKSGHNVMRHRNVRRKKEKRNFFDFQSITRHQRTLTSGTFMI